MYFSIKTSDGIQSSLFFWRIYLHAFGTFFIIINYKNVQTIDLDGKLGIQGDWRETWQMKEMATIITSLKYGCSIWCENWSLDYKLPQNRLAGFRACFSSLSWSIKKLFNTMKLKEAVSVVITKALNCLNWFLMKASWKKKKPFLKFQAKLRKKPWVGCSQVDQKFKYIPNPQIPITKNSSFLPCSSSCSGWHGKSISC